MEPTLRQMEPGGWLATGYHYVVGKPHDRHHRVPIGVFGDTKDEARQRWVEAARSRIILHASTIAQ